MRILFGRGSLPPLLSCSPPCHLQSEFLCFEAHPTFVAFYHFPSHGTTFFLPWHFINAWVFLPYLMAFGNFFFSFLRLDETKLCFHPPLASIVSSLGYLICPRFLGPLLPVYTGNARVQYKFLPPSLNPPLDRGNIDSTTFFCSLSLKRGHSSDPTILTSSQSFFFLLHRL